MLCIYAGHVHVHSVVQWRDLQASVGQSCSLSGAREYHGDIPAWNKHVAYSTAVCTALPSRASSVKNKAEFSPLHSIVGWRHALSCDKF